MSSRFVYVLENCEVPPRYYTGLSSDIATRLAVHNAGHCRHTAKHRPRSVDGVIEFADERRAVALTPGETLQHRFEHFLLAKAAGACRCAV
jgi:putative endonuclease